MYPRTHKWNLGLDEKRYFQMEHSRKIRSLKLFSESVPRKRTERKLIPEEKLELRAFS